jgi:hypothetical protein
MDDLCSAALLHPPDHRPLILGRATRFLIGFTFREVRQGALGWRPARYRLFRARRALFARTGS